MNLSKFLSKNNEFKYRFIINNINRLFDEELKDYLKDFMYDKKFYELIDILLNDEEFIMSLSKDTLINLINMSYDVLMLVDAINTKKYINKEVSIKDLALNYKKLDVLDSDVLSDINLYLNLIYDYKYKENERKLKLVIDNKVE